MSRRVVIGGASGLIGSALTEALRARGDEVLRLVRRSERARDEISWDPETGRLDAERLFGADIVVLLNGASVGRMPWTRGYREQLRRSRLLPVRTMVRALHELGPKAPALVSGSAVGYYGSTSTSTSGPDPASETDPPGDTFLAQLCAEWEAEALRAEPISRVALMRTAPIIHRRGVLKPLVVLTALGIGGPLGGGTQGWPWMSLEDEVRAILHIIDRGISGPVNLCGPTAATANDIGRALATEMRRPFWLPAPRWALRLVLGQAATESLLTADAEVTPDVLLKGGFEFSHATAREAVRAAIAER